MIRSQPTPPPADEEDSEEKIGVDLLWLPEGPELGTSSLCPTVVTEVVHLRPEAPEFVPLVQLAESLEGSENSPSEVELGNAKPAANGEGAIREAERVDQELRRDEPAVVSEQLFGSTSGSMA